MWKQCIILSAGTELKNIRQLRDGITFWARLCYSFFFFLSLTTSLSKCNPEIQRADRWSMTTSSAVPPIPTTVLIYCHSLDMSSQRLVYTFHPVSGRWKGGDSIVCVSDSKRSLEWLACVSLEVMSLFNRFYNRGVGKRDSEGEFGTGETNPKLAELI